MTIYIKHKHKGKKLYARPTHRVKYNGEKYYSVRRGVVVPASSVKILR